MNEHLNSNPTRLPDLQSNNSEQIYAAQTRDRSRAQNAEQARQCGLDTGARGWRYVYQTH